MSSPPPPSPSPATVEVGRRPWIPIGLFLGWTVFVWAGRMRNALSDATLTTSEQRVALVLAASFLVPALVLAVVLARTVRTHDEFGGTLVAGTWALAMWTTGLWVVRVVDIAIFSDNELPFIVVHVVLAVVSISLAALAVRALSGAQDGGTRAVGSPRREGTGVSGD